MQKDWTRRGSILPGQNIGSHDANGWLGGAQVGCNYQVGGLGVRHPGRLRLDRRQRLERKPAEPARRTISSNVKNLSSVTGRVGYAWDRFLGYVKGGGAWEKDEYTATVRWPDRHGKPSP